MPATVMFDASRSYPGGTRTKYGTKVTKRGLRHEVPT